jgi:hypothetical protein
MDFTVVHPHWFLLGLALGFFPRLTTACMALFGSLMLPVDVGYKILWVLGWLFLPRLLIAILSMVYFASNPFLVILAWIIAFSGETCEKTVVVKAKK